MTSTKGICNRKMFNKRSLILRESCHSAYCKIWTGSTLDTMLLYVRKGPYSRGYEIPRFQVVEALQKYVIIESSGLWHTADLMECA